MALLHCLSVDWPRVRALFAALPPPDWTLWRQQDAHLDAVHDVGSLPRDACSKRSFIVDGYSSGAHPSTHTRLFVANWHTVEYANDVDAHTVPTYGRP